MTSLVSAEEKPPNVLYIMSDDHAAYAIGAYGGRLAALNPTPTIDRLAKEGMLFENAFCTNSICAPSRACVITGQYPHTNGAYDLGGKIEADRQYLAIEMKKAGYQTAMVGKWHIKEEPGAFDFYTVLTGQGKYHDPEFRVRGEKGWPQDAITEITLDWLKEGREEGKPFLPDASLTRRLITTSSTPQDTTTTLRMWTSLSQIISGLRINQSLAPSRRGDTR